MDMDSFFVEVERLDQPSLVGQPVAVGGVGPRGVIASASYEARSYGVQSAQPTSMALKLCPSLQVIPPRHRRYGEVSADVFGVFRSVTPSVEGLSLDEGFLDVGGLRHHFESSVEVGSLIRVRIKEELGLPCSVGVAATKFVAKLASEAAKPDGLRHITLKGQTGFLHALPAEAVWGVGPATLASLQKLGVETVGDIAEIPLQTLTTALGRAVGSHLHDLADGRDPRRVEPDSRAKSVSVEETYERDLHGREVIEAALLAHSHRLSERLRRGGLAGRTLSLKVRFPDFRTVSRTNTSPVAIDGARELYHASLELLDQVDLTGPVRLIGLGASGLETSEKERQLKLGRSEGWDRVEDAVSEVRRRFGATAVGPARLAVSQRAEEDQEPG